MKAHKDLTNVYVDKYGKLIYATFEYSSTFDKYVEYLYYILNLVPVVQLELSDTPEENITFEIVQYDINY